MKTLLSKRVYDTVQPLSIICVLMITVATASFNIFREKDLGTVFESTTIENGQDIYPGGKLDVVFTFNRTKICKSEVDYFMIDATGKSIFKQRDIAGSGQIGKSQMTRIELTVPPDIKPMDYVFRMTFHTDCGGTLTGSIAAPDAHFVVRPPPETP